MTAYTTTLEQLQRAIRHHLEDYRGTGAPSPVPSTAHIVLLRRALVYLGDLQACQREMARVWDYLKPNESNDLPWSDEIIIAHDNAVAEARDAGENKSDPPGHFWASWPPAPVKFEVRGGYYVRPRKGTG